MCGSFTALREIAEKNCLKGQAFEVGRQRQTVFQLLKTCSATQGHKARRASGRVSERSRFLEEMHRQFTPLTCSPPERACGDASSNNDWNNGVARSAANESSCSLALGSPRSTAIWSVSVDASISFAS